MSIIAALFIKQVQLREGFYDRNNVPLIAGHARFVDAHTIEVQNPNCPHRRISADGFVVATGLLHLCGILIGTLTRWPAGARLIQGLGVMTATLGSYFLMRSLGAVA